MLNLAQTLASSRRQLERIDSDGNDQDISGRADDTPDSSSQSSDSSADDSDVEIARVDEKESIDSARRSSLQHGHASVNSFRLVRVFRENETQTSSTSLFRNASKPSLLLAVPRANEDSVLNLHRLAVEHHYGAQRRISQSQVSKLSFDCTPYSGRHVRRMSRRERPSVVDQYRMPYEEALAAERVHRSERGSVSTGTPHEKSIIDLEYGAEAAAVPERKVYLPKVVRLTITTSALVLVLAIYCVICSFVMQALEKDLVVTDEVSCLSIKEHNRTGAVIDLLLTHLERLSEPNGFRMSWSTVRENLANNSELLEAIDALKATESGCSRSEVRSESWNFHKSAMFVMTVVTTIGYGHYSPKSTSGRLATIIIAIFGVPLLVVAVAELAGLFTHSVKLLIRVVRHCGRTELMRERRKHNISSAVILQIWMGLLLIPAYILITAVLYYWLEDWSYFDSVYFTFITYSTIGFGDMTPSSDKSELMTVYGNLMVMLGVGLYAMLTQTIGTKYMLMQRAIHRYVRRFDRNLLEHARASVKRQTSKLMKAARDESEDGEAE